MLPGSGWSRYNALNSLISARYNVSVIVSVFSSTSHLPEQISVLLVAVGRVLAVEVGDEIVNNLVQAGKFRGEKWL